MSLDDVEVHMKIVVYRKTPEGNVELYTMEHTMSSEELKANMFMKNKLAEAVKDNMSS